MTRRQSKCQRVSKSHGKTQRCCICLTWELPKEEFVLPGQETNGQCFCARAPNWSHAWLAWMFYESGTALPIEKCKWLSGTQLDATGRNGPDQAWAVVKRFLIQLKDVGRRKVKIHETNSARNRQTLSPDLPHQSLGAVETKTGPATSQPKPQSAPVAP